MNEQAGKVEGEGTFPTNNARARGKNGAVKMPRQPKPNGRPSIRTKEIEDVILAGIRKGESLIKICKEDPSLPHRDTVFDWLAVDEERRAAKTVEEGEVLFLDRYNIATKIRTAAMAEEILQISDDGSNDTYRDADGKVMVDYDHIQRAKLRVDTRKWLMAKLEPKRYGERPAETHISTTLNFGGFVISEAEQLRIKERMAIALRESDQEPQ